MAGVQRQGQSRTADAGMSGSRKRQGMPRRAGATVAAFVGALTGVALTLTLAPEPPSIVCLEEADRGVHPRILREVLA